MAKLVLYMPDGTQHDIPLDKERVSIGRRPDNDVCLPYPAVSGEHAAVVTILADSFLEDLGSTNGTLVNGKPIAKHFLRDNDHIDIGRQRLVYFSNDETQAVPLLPEALRHEVRGLHEQVERVRERREEQRKPQKAPAPGAAPDAQLLDEDLLADIESSAAQDSATGRDDGAAAPPVRATSGGRSGAPKKAARHPSTVASRLASTWSPDPPGDDSGDDEAAPVAQAERSAASPVAQPDADALLLAYRLRVLNGPNEGREVALNRPQVSVGRVGTQVACVGSREGRWRVWSLEGPEPLQLNGKPVAADGAALAPGDRLRVAGTDLIFEER